MSKEIIEICVCLVIIISVLFLVLRIQHKLEKKQISVEGDGITKPTIHIN